MDLKEEAILGPAVADHWYYVAKGRALRRFLGDHPVDDVLDVGAGSGVFTRQLVDAGLARRGTCVDPGYPAERVETYNGCSIAFVRKVDAVPQKLILMMDVLEHVNDDVGLLKEYTDRMPGDGRVVVTVPAFQFLWSGHDVFLEHKRRYTLAHAEDVIRRANLRVLKGRYFFGALFPVVAAMRLRDRLRLNAGEIAAESQLRPYPAVVNRVLAGIHDVELVTLFPVNRLAGLTAFCLAART